MKHLNVLTTFSRKLNGVQRINSTPLTRNRRHVDVRQKQKEKKNTKKELTLTTGISETSVSFTWYPQQRL